MCGIGGFFTASRVQGNALLARMQAGLRHRGPDGEGRWQDPRGTAGLVHARLAIIDLSHGGAQPMHSADGRYVIVFNGEIYNYRALRVELETDGARFATQSDTEVLLALVVRHGVAGLRRLRGMFALALWDAHTQRGLLARDGFGIKPLYYADSSSGLMFGSELRTLLATGAVEFHLDAVALGDFFATGSVPEPASLVEGVAVVPPGHALEWERGATRLKRFWGVEFPSPTVFDRNEALSLTRAALEDSIAAHFVSDVPVGLFLSGGIDSTALLAVAAHAGLARGMDTFSISVDRASHDEAAIAAASARRFGSRHHVMRLDAQSADASLHDFLDSMDVPSVDGFNTWTVSRFARSHGMKVVLSGLGGDEVFGGYPSFRNVPKLHALVSAARCLPWLADFAGGAVASRSRSSRGRRLGALLQQPAGLSESYRAYRGVFPPADVRKLVTHFTGSTVARVPEADATIELPASVPDRVSYLELTRYMRNQLLRDSDVMSMAHGLELRLPLVDQRFFDTAARIAPGIRLQPGKRLLVDAVGDLPASVTTSPKRGFAFPFQAWFGQTLESRLADVYRELPVQPAEWYQQWAILVFTHWLRGCQRAMP